MLLGCMEYYILQVAIGLLDSFFFFLLSSWILISRIFHPLLASDPMLLLGGILGSKIFGYMGQAMGFCSGCH